MKKRKEGEVIVVMKNLKGGKCHFPYIKVLSFTLVSN